MDEVTFDWVAGKAAGILQIDGLVSTEVVELLLTKLEPIYGTVAKQGKTLGGLDTSTKYCMDLGLSESNAKENGYEWDREYAYIEDSLTESLTAAVNYYKSKVRALYGWNDIMDTGFNIQMYPKFYGRYMEHVDSAPSDHRSAPRVLAAIFYLNDVNVGGQTSFVDYGLSVVPKVGRLILFPAIWTHTHKAEVPISDDKWIINTFLVSSEAVEMVGHYDSHLEQQRNEQDHDHPHPHPHPHD